MKQKRVIIFSVIAIAAIATVIIVGTVVFSGKTQEAMEPTPTSTPIEEVSSKVIVSPDIDLPEEESELFSETTTEESVPAVTLDEEGSSQTTIGDILVDRDEVILPEMGEPKDEGE